MSDLWNEDIVVEIKSFPPSHPCFSTTCYLWVEYDEGDLERPFKVFSGYTSSRGRYGSESDSFEEGEAATDEEADQILVDLIKCCRLEGQGRIPPHWLSMVLSNRKRFGWKNVTA